METNKLSDKISLLNIEVKEFIISFLKTNKIIKIYSELDLCYEGMYLDDNGFYVNGCIESIYIDNGNICVIINDENGNDVEIEGNNIPIETLFNIVELIENYPNILSIFNIK